MPHYFSIGCDGGGKEEEEKELANQQVANQQAQQGDCILIESLVLPKKRNVENFYFDYVPPGGGLIIGFSTRFRVYSMPGAITHATHREEVLRGADAVVFVADSRAGREQANLGALIGLESLLAELDLALTSIPIVLQINHIDAPNARPMADVTYDLNPYGFTVLPAAARHSRGVLETHETITRSTVDRIQDHLAGNQTAISLTAVHRASRERDDEIIRRHVEAIRVADQGQGFAVQGQGVVLGDGRVPIVAAAEVPPPARWVSDNPMFFY